MRVGYYYCDNVLTPDECQHLIEAGQADLMPALIDGGNTPDKKLRAGQTSFFCRGDSPENDELLGRVVDAMCWASNEAYGHGLAQIEPIQFTDYGPGDHYAWHYDQHGIKADGNRIERDVSASLELCDPESYEGGGLEFFGLPHPIPERRQGRLIVFSSMMVHRARRIKAGRRCSLVLWGHA